MQALEDEIYENNPEMKGKTLNAIERALGEKYESFLLNEDEHILKSLKKIDAVFNLSTGLRGESKQSHIPAILERLRIPYTGSSVLTHALGLSKPKSKEIFIANNIPTPKFQTFRNPEIHLNHSLEFPLIVKPTNKGSSRGIVKVGSYNELEIALKRIIANYGCAIVEEFIEGKEITVGILGNKKLEVLPVLETNFEDLEVTLYNFSIKSRIGYTTERTFPAKLTGKQEKKIREVAIEAYRSIGCRDYARVDIRLRNDIPYVLEINTLPGLYLDYSAIPVMTKFEGLSFNNLIKTIFNYATTRYNLI